MPLILIFWIVLLPPTVRVKKKIVIACDSPLLERYKRARAPPEHRHALKNLRIATTAYSPARTHVQ